MRVFISHASEERNLYEKIAQVLRPQGIVPWPPEKAAMARPLSDELQHAIRACEACIFIATPASVDSGWCLAEVGAFWGLGKRIYTFKPASSLNDQRLPPHLRDKLWDTNPTNLVLQIIEDFRRARRKRWMRWCGAIIAALIIATITLLACLPLWERIIPIAEFLDDSGSIVGFRDGPPYNNIGREFQLFSHSKAFGGSIIGYEMKKHDDRDGYYMSIRFNLGQSIHNSQPYCGVYSEFGRQPPAPVIKLSAFDGITFLARHKTENSEGHVRFALQVAIYGLPEDSYHEFPIDLPPNLADFKPIPIKFSQLHQPEKRTGDGIFDKTKVFRLALVIRGEKSQGRLEFYDMRAKRP